MTGNDRLYSALTKMIKTIVGSPIMVGEVKAVDQSNYTADIQPVDGSPLFHDVRLKSAIDANDAGLIVIPKVGATAICLRMLEDSAVMVMCSDINSYLIKTDSGVSIELTQGGEIKINGDAHKGLVKHDDLKSALDTIVQNVGALHSGCTAAFSALAGLDGGASSSAFAAASVQQPVVTTTLENGNVKHG